MAQLRIEHIYYRHDTIAEQVERAAEFHKRFGEADMLHPACVASTVSDKEQPDFSVVHPGSVLGKPVVEELAPVDYQEMMAELCTFVYNHVVYKSCTHKILDVLFLYILGKSPKNLAVNTLILFGMLTALILLSDGEFELKLK